jgi:epoxyqueuosine reductase
MLLPLERKNTHELSAVADLTRKAKALGFVAVGFSPSARPPFYDLFCEWIAKGWQGEMHWLERHMALLENPQGLLEGCNTVISLAYPYSTQKPRTPDGLTAARYSEPGKPDYHNRLKEIGLELARSLLEFFPEAKTRVCVDSAPILERSFAHAAGIGFIGKNNALIVPGYGSFVFLAEILTTARLPVPDKRPMPSECGDCERCVKTCPTGALEAPFFLNANRCLSYLTIEHRGDVPVSMGEKMGNCFLGCDVCQEVCPFNGSSKEEALCLPASDEFLNMEETSFKAQFGQTAFSRAGLKKIKENIRMIKGRSPISLTPFPLTF